MTDRVAALTALRAFLVAPSDAHAQALRPHLADEADVAVHTINATGRDAVIADLQQSLFHNVVFGGHWEDPESEGVRVTQVLAMPPKGIAAGCKFGFTFDKHDKIAKIEGEWLLPPTELQPEPIKLTTAIRDRINGAEQDQMPVLFGYVTPEGRPEQVYRSSTHTRGEDQLAFWNPRPDGSFLASIASSPRVSMIYRHRDTHEMLEMSGQAHVVSDDDEARDIYKASADAARNLSSSQDGVAVVVDLDRVTGLIHAAETGAIERILMVKQAAG